MEPTKRCKVCGLSKPLDDFYRAVGMRDGHRNDCKACNLAEKHARYVTDPEPTKARVRRWQRENPERYRETLRRIRQSPEGKKREREGHLKRTHGITLDDYEALVAVQQGRCAICGRSPEKSFHIDHDHVTGRIRGLLCSSCNHALGLFGESPARLRRAAAYATRQHANGRLETVIRLRLRRELLGQK